MLVHRRPILSAHSSYGGILVSDVVLRRFNSQGQQRQDAVNISLGVGSLINVIPGVHESGMRALSGWYISIDTISFLSISVQSNPKRELKLRAQFGNRGNILHRVVDVRCYGAGI